VATIGAFDGVHEGPRKVLAALTAKGKELGLPTVVIVFEPLPREYFAPLEAPARLMSFREKFDAFRELGIDRVMRIPFNAAFREMGAEDFIQQIFVDGLKARYIAVGDDFHFGRDQGGDFSLLKRAGEKYGFNVVDTVTLSVAGDRVSSSRIRQALGADDFELAQQLLGRPYSMSGKVISGEKLGRKLGAPTANLQLRRLRAALSGEYAVEVNGLDGYSDSIKGVANIGTRPTVDDSLKAVLEVHLFDFDENIYGKNISVIFRKKIRQEKKFSSIEELKTNIHNDIEVGKKFFNINYD
jgi:riboflavin kinase/FMN adenylyltransferase